MSAAPMYPALVADIGGTNARFGWIAAPGAAVAQVRTLAVADHPSPADAARAYLAWRAAAEPGMPAVPRRAAIAVATAVVDDAIAFTNSAWGFSRRGLQAALGLDALRVINDFEALALALPTLTAAQLASDRPLALPPTATLAVIGPGTGLGVGGVCPSPAGWTALPGEGGHATLAPADDADSELLAWVRRRWDHVSAERLLSGTGLPLLHEAVCDLHGLTRAATSTPAIVDAALSGRDAACAQTLDVFCALLGGFAGSVALLLGARGGVYIGGGIVPRLGARFFGSRFRARFEAKGRFRRYLEAIPTPVITDTLAALAGAAAALEPPGAAATPP